MRLPWVSREAYDADLHYARFERDTARASDVLARRDYGDMNRRYDALLEKYHALKLQGAVAVEPQTPIERKEIDPVTQRINVLSAGKPGLRAQMLRQLQSDRMLAGMDDMEILQRIEQGVTTGDGVMA